MKRLLAVDCDLVVAPSDVHWKAWLDEQSDWSGLNVPEDNPEYNLGLYYPSVDDPMEFWRSLDYFNMSPIQGSVKALEKLSKYFQIAFVSKIKGNHTKSKYYWLKEHFSFMYAYAATAEKHIVDCVAMVDDRNSVLKEFDFNKRIRYSTPYKQDVECKVHIEFSEWNSGIVEMICDEYL